ncbi:MAG: hypothetical protein IJR57_01605 [Ruminococcus sp.]|nr:hypothetical protein [Ruminococcus sp.]
MEEVQGNQVMDIGQFVFPFIMAVLTNSLMIIIIYFLRKVPYFSNLFSVWFMVILYLFCVLRIFLPIEFPGLQIILEDRSVYVKIFEAFIQRDADGIARPNTALIIFLCAWAVGIIVISLWNLISQRKFFRYLMANGDYAIDHERAIFSDVVKDVLKNDKNVVLRKTDVITGTVVVGLIHKTVLIPDETYTDDELKMMFRHECMHIKNKDLWIKLLVQIYCCIFWWNPFAYLLKSDLDVSLEMKCDLNATKDFSDAEKLTYIETLKNRSVARSGGKPFVICAELADGKKKSKLVARIKAVLAEPPKRVGQIVINAIIALLFLGIFVGSYVFIWQPVFETELTRDEYELESTQIIVDNTNGYLVKQEDGNYIFYVTDTVFEKVSKEEVEQGMYEDYPIYE